jgi:hypothetical protein
LISRSFAVTSNLSIFTKRAANMISDSQLYSLAIFLGSAAMMLIVLYHFLEVNSEDHAAAQNAKPVAGKKS